MYAGALQSIVYAGALVYQVAFFIQSPSLCGLGFNKCVV